MTHPFPGMDPWLEHPNLWGDVHFRLVAALARYLSSTLAPRYYVAVGIHTYIAAPSPEPTSIRYPDVMVVGAQQSSPAQAAESVAVAEPIIVQVPVPETIEEAYLEVREAETGEVITAIELLSPANKRPGPGRDKYERKRLEILGTRTHLVEIDLLRGWPAMPFEGNDQSSHYRILIRRGEEGARARLYAFNVQDVIPTFPLPLQAGDSEPIVDLGELLRGIYAEARYDLRVNYNRPPIPQLSPPDAEWAAELLRSRRPE